MSGILFAAIIAALTAALATPAVRAWAVRMGAVDQPSARRINTEPMPRAGGISIYLGFVVATILTVAARQWRSPHTAIWTPQVTGTLLAITLIAAVGLIDDLKDLKPKWQALGIVGAALIMAAFGVRIDGVTNPFGGAYGLNYNPASNWQAFPLIVSVLVTILWVFIVTKTVDAIDGVDGLAAGVCAISAATLALMASQIRTAEGMTLPLMAAAVAGACIGFLRHNYHPARIIMGTIGAQVLGLTLAAISILGAFKAAALVSVLVPVLVFGVPIFDFTHVLTRRLLARAPLTVADRRHFHHRLLDRGWNQKQVVWFIYSVTIVLCVTALALFHIGR